jgi:hypothetical protein
MSPDSGEMVRLYKPLVASQPSSSMRDVFLSLARRIEKAEDSAMDGSQAASMKIGERQASIMQTVFIFSLISYAVKIICIFYRDAHVGVTAY